MTTLQELILVVMHEAGCAMSVDEVMDACNDAVKEFGSADAAIKAIRKRTGLPS